MGQSYQLVLVGQSQPKDRFFFKVSFYDYYDEILEVNYLRQVTDTFTVPYGYHYYEIALYHGGLLSLDFHQVILKSSEARVETSMEMPYSLVGGGLSAPYLVFDELGKGPKISSLMTSKEEWTYLTSILSHGQLYLREEVSDLLDTISHKQADLKLVGYGPISNIAALYHGYRLSCPTFVTEDFLSPNTYLDLYASFNLSRDVEAFLANYQDLLVNQDVTIYALGLLEQSDPAAAFLLDYRSQLTYLKRGGPRDVCV